jgi:hypothetical protein
MKKIENKSFDQQVEFFTAFFTLQKCYEKKLKTKALINMWNFGQFFSTLQKCLYEKLKTETLISRWTSSRCVVFTARDDQQPMIIRKSCRKINK